MSQRKQLVVLVLAAAALGFGFWLLLQTGSITVIEKSSSGTGSAD